MSETGSVARRLFMPVFRVYRGFLEPDAHAALLTWAIENQSKFEPTRVGYNKYNPSRRKSLGVYDFGPTAELFRQRLFELAPTLMRDLRVTPFEPSEVELQLVANHDGAFLKRHVDTFAGDRRRARDRVLSVVYYFHSEPKAFSGGALRFYPYGAKEDEGPFVDVQPDQNTLLVFPSWALHEVLPVNCPSGRFSDSRFNVNCWVLRQPDGNDLVDRTLIATTDQSKERS